MEAGLDARNHENFDLFIKSIYSFFLSDTRTLLRITSFTVKLIVRA